MPKPSYTMAYVEVMRRLMATGLDEDEAETLISVLLAGEQPPPPLESAPVEIAEPTETQILQVIDNLLVTAFEGGSNYWYHIEDRNLRGPQVTRQVPPTDMSPYWPVDVPLDPNGYLLIRAEDHPGPENGLWRLDREHLFNGLALLQQRFPHHYADAITGNDDGTTGDIFLQLALFGEVVFG